MVTVAVLLMAACAADPTPTQAPTATADPTPPPTSAPTATPTPNPTPTPQPTPTPEQVEEEAFEAEHLPEKFDARVAGIREKMETVEAVWTVYFHSDDWQTPGKGTVMGEVFELLKLENIAAHAGYQAIDPEQVLAAEPDIIIAESLESILDNPELSGLHMVQDTTHIPHHIFVLGEDLSLEVDAPNFMDAVDELAAFVYPEVFGTGEESEDGHSHANGHGHGDEEQEDGGHGHGHGDDEHEDSDDGHGHGHSDDGHEDSDDGHGHGHSDDGHEDSDDGHGHDEDENHSH